MRNSEQVLELLQELDNFVADDLEDQDIDFKEWDEKSLDKAVKLVVHMAVCMANGGGGTVVFGVAEHKKGRSNAILGIPNFINVNDLKLAVYNQTDPKLSPVFEELYVPEGTGRLLVMQVYKSLPLYTDTKGKGSIRVGKNCQPLTGTIRSRLLEESGANDFTAVPVAKADSKLISASAMEVLRNMAQVERAPKDLLALPDIELLNALGLVRDGQLTRAAILLGGTEAAIREFIPNYVWTFLAMDSDINYSQREDGYTAILYAIKRVEDLIVSYNPITTFEHGLYHFEYRAWPAVSIREALLNAYSHVDLRVASPILTQVYPNQLEISNAGGLIGGITEDNILHHKPTARNPLLVQALSSLRLVNRSNLGISRMFSSLLMEGKEPPQVRDVGKAVTVTLPKKELNAEFRLFVAEQAEKNIIIGVDELVLLNYLIQHLEIDVKEAAHICQRSEEKVREILSTMENLGYVEHGGTKRSAYWCMVPTLYNRFNKDGNAEKRRRIDWDAAKTHILSILIERSRRNEEGLSNAEIRQITHYDRNSVIRLMKELRVENPSISEPGKGRNARYSIE
jgi:ATP-dependent DNA helicase RecG